MKILLIPILIFSSFLQGGGQPINIPIPHLDKWKLGAGTQLIQLPDGTYAIDALGSSFSVDLGVTPAQIQAYPNNPPGYAREGVYRLTFSTVNYFPAYPGQYDMEISYGTQQLGECYGWGTAFFTPITLDFPSPHYLIIYHSLPSAGAPQGHSNLQITGSVPEGWQLLFKDFSLTFTPTN